MCEHKKKTDTIYIPTIAGVIFYVVYTPLYTWEKRTLTHLIGSNFAVIKIGHTSQKTALSQLVVQLQKLLVLGQKANNANVLMNYTFFKQHCKITTIKFQKALQLVKSNSL